MLHRACLTYEMTYIGQKYCTKGYKKKVENLSETDRNASRKIDIMSEKIQRQAQLKAPYNKQFNSRLKININFFFNAEIKSCIRTKQSSVKTIIYRKNMERNVKYAHIR